MKDLFRIPTFKKFQSGLSKSFGSGSGSQKVPDLAGSGSTTLVPDGPQCWNANA